MSLHTELPTSHRKLLYVTSFDTYKHSFEILELLSNFRKFRFLINFQRKVSIFQLVMLPCVLIVCKKTVKQTVKKTVKKENIHTCMIIDHVEVLSLNYGSE